MKNEYKYLVANPAGVILVKCKTMEDASRFIDKHLEKNQKNYQILIRRRCMKSEYQIINIDEIIKCDDVYKND